MMDWNLLQQIASIVAGVVATVATMTWFLAGQFNKMRLYTEVMFEKIMNKLEYHERHDDQRFGELRDDIWEIRLRNAAKDGYIRKAKNEEDQSFNNRDNPAGTPKAL